MPRRPQTPKTDAPYPPGWEPFLAAINADLDDDTVRLAFADWLQENGDEARAEFIRIQCAIARGGSTDTARAERLLTTNRRHWLRGLPRYLADNPERCEFRRGFVAAVSLQGSKWETDSESIRRVTALEHLTLQRVYAHLLRAPGLEGLRELTLNGMTSETIAVLTHSAIIPSLVALSFTPIPAAVIGDSYLAALFANPALTRLRRLHLGRTHRTNAVAAALANTPHLVTLEELHVQGGSVTNVFDAVGAEALSRFTGTNLRVLGLSGNPIGDGGLRHLLRSPSLRGLVTLRLAQCNLTSESARLLAEWEGLKNIRSLQLNGNNLDRPAIELLVNSPNAVNLPKPLD